MAMLAHPAMLTTMAVLTTKATKYTANAVEQLRALTDEKLRPRIQIQRASTRGVTSVVSCSKPTGRGRSSANRASCVQQAL